MTLFDIIQRGDLKSLKRRIRNGCDLSLLDDEKNSLMHCAAMLQHDRCLRTLLISGGGFETPNQLGMTPLHLAARHGRTLPMLALLKAGASMDARDYNFCTPLHLAVQRGQDAAVRLLLQCGAAINPVEKIGRTPLHVAIFMGQLNCFDELVKAKANPLVLDNHGLLPENMPGFLQEKAVHYRISWERNQLLQDLVRVDRSHLQQKRI